VNSRIIIGDCLEAMPTLDANSIDSIVTDPPYHLTTGKKGGSGEASVNLDSPYGRARVTTGFMGMKWDGGDIAMRPEVWAAALRVAKPGAYLLAFGGTRTHHRMMCAIEDAGWELRDVIMWVYGSGFPKSNNGVWGGTALKPAWEPIIMARKALVGTVAENVAAHGVGGLNIDSCRVSVDPAVDDMLREVERKPRESQTWEKGSGFKNETNSLTGVPAAGRWPANLIHDGSDEVLAAFPDAPGQIADASSSSSRKTQNTYGKMMRGNGRDNEPSADSDNSGVVGFNMKLGQRRLDSGSAARFFYCAKTSKIDRDEGCGDLGLRPLAYGNQAQAEVARGNTEHTGDGGMNTVKMRGNNHPTVKPTDLMRYLCRLVTPQGGVILDPFTGSGRTGKAAMLEGFQFIGIEREPDYAAIAEARIAFGEQERLNQTAQAGLAFA
jgi:site-specific DNA-methyltransferase (adenine-specific)